MKSDFDFRVLATPVFLACAALGGAACSIFAELALANVLRHAGAIAIFAIRFVLPALLAGGLSYVVSGERYRGAVHSSALSSVRTHLWHASLCYAILLWIALWSRRCSSISPCYPDLIIGAVELALSAFAAAAANVLARLRAPGRIAPVA